MHLDTLDNTSKISESYVDSTEYLTDVEEMVELETDTESTFDSLYKLPLLEDGYDTILTNIDRESITESQLHALRVSVATSIDTEDFIGNVNSALALDLESIKDFLKDSWKKFKHLLIKANTLFKKLFIKFLNLVSFRKGTIESLLEEVESASTLNTEIKNKKLAEGLSLHLTFSTELTGKEVDLSNYKEVHNINSSKDTLKYLNNSVEIIELLAKALKKAIENGDTTSDIDITVFNNVSKGLEHTGSFLASGSKMAKGSVFIPAGTYGLKIHGLLVTKTGKTNKHTLNGKGKPTSIIGVNQKSLISLLKSAGKANGDFKSIVDDTFDVVDDMMDIAERIDSLLDGIGALKEHDESKRFFINNTSRRIKGTLSSLPWFAFKCTLNLYKEIGGVIKLGKEAIKTKA